MSHSVPYCAKSKFLSCSLCVIWNLQITLQYITEAEFFIMCINAIACSILKFPLIAEITVRLFYI